MVFTCCLLACANVRGDKRPARRSRGSGLGDTLDPRPLVAADRPGLKEWGDPTSIWDTRGPRANAAPGVDAAFSRSPAPPTE